MPNNITDNLAGIIFLLKKKEKVKIEVIKKTLNTITGKITTALCSTPTDTSLSFTTMLNCTPTDASLSFTIMFNCMHVYMFQSCIVSLLFWRCNVSLGANKSCLITHSRKQRSDRSCQNMFCYSNTRILSNWESHQNKTVKNRGGHRSSYSLLFPHIL